MFMKQHLRRSSNMTYVKATFSTPCKLFFCLLQLYTTILCCDLSAFDAFYVLKSHTDESCAFDLTNRSICVFRYIVTQLVSGPVYTTMFHLKMKKYFLCLFKKQQWSENDRCLYGNTEMTENVVVCMSGQ